MENYSLFMGAAAVMKMAVEMAAVSMEKPSGGTSRPTVPEQRLLSPRSWLRDGGSSEGFAYRGFLVRVSMRGLYIGERQRRRVEGRPHHGVAGGQGRATLSSGATGPPVRLSVLLASAPSPLFVRRCLLELRRPANLRRAEPRRARLLLGARHWCFFKLFSASPSTDLLANRGPPNHRQAFLCDPPHRGKEIPKPKPPVQCGSCIIGSRQGSPFFKFSGLESCRLWQGTFFYVRNNGAADLIDLPPFDPAPPTRANWGYNPKESHNETNRIIRFMKQRMKDTNICSDDIIRTFISRRVLPLKRRAHKMSEMYGPGDPTKITGLPLSKKDVVLKARQICQTAMPEDWEWGLRPFSSTNPPTQEAKDRFPDIDSTGEALAGSASSTNVPSANINPQVHEHVAPLQAEAGQEFVDKLMAWARRTKPRPTPARAKLLHPSASDRTFRSGRRRERYKSAIRTSWPRTQARPRGGLRRIARTSTPPPRKPGTFGCRQLLPPYGRHHKVGCVAPTPRITAQGGPCLPSETHDAAPTTSVPDDSGRADLWFLPS
ncbi:hypothetical protein QYE76_052636 [Lolium multiflorum]|uniref:Uncharacterized protein n=1 Tax=Lolium multiflorum TaxID=4521 RepID=A0AAD8WJ38_LOLMU|nr:hypothetical protein QYE76_052636 [Lolium multiflorum]